MVCCGNCWSHCFPPTDGFLKFSHMKELLTTYLKDKYLYKLDLPLMSAKTGEDMPWTRAASWETVGVSTSVLRPGLPGLFAVSLHLAPKDHHVLCLSFLLFCSLFSVTSSPHPTLVFLLFSFSQVSVQTYPPSIMSHK